MGSRGGGRPRRDRAAETKAFIDAVKQDKSISDITRKDLISNSEKQLAEYTANSAKLPGLQQEIRALQQGNEFGINDKKISELTTQIQKFQGGAFDAGAASLRKDLDGAREGTAPKFRYRQALEKKRELIADRPGQKQLIFSRGR